MDSSNFHHTLSVFVILIGLCYGEGVLPSNLMNGTVGGSVTFTTTLNPTDGPYLVVIWNVNGTIPIITATSSDVIGPGYEGRITLDRLTGSLELRDLTLGDSGDYLLTITIDGAGQILGSTTLAVYEVVPRPTITISTNPPIIEGNSVNLTCDFAGSISNLQWMKDGQVLSSHDNNRVLSLSPVKRTDSGLYLCRVSNPVSSQNATYNLTVNFGPDSVTIAGPSEIEVGQKLTLTCFAESTPTASYSWILNGTEQLGSSHIFTRESVQYSDSGNYTCTASNSITELNALGFHILAVGAKGSLSKGLSAGAIAGIVIGVLLAVGGGVAVGLFFAHKKGLLKKESSNGRSVGNGGTGRSNGDVGNQDLHYAECQFRSRNGGSVQVGQTPSSDVQSQYAQVKRPAPQPVDTTYAQVRKN